MKGEKPHSREDTSRPLKAKRKLVNPAWCKVRWKDMFRPKSKHIFSPLDLRKEAR